MKDRKELIDQFLSDNNLKNFVIDKVAGDASFRSYFRVKTFDQKKFIIMDAPSEFEDVKPFCLIDEFLIKNNFSAPKIFVADYKNGFLLLEDFGDCKFSQFLSEIPENQKPKAEESLYKAAIDILVKLHQVDLGHDLKRHLKIYDAELLEKEVLLFVDWYLPFIAKEPLNESKRSEFCYLWRDLFKKLSHPEVLVLRDYHADNLMILEAAKDNKSYQGLGILDFQDAVIGSRAYDLVSLLEDARREVPELLQEKILQYYLDKSKPENSSLLLDYQILSLQRNIKIVGIFSRLAIRDNKKNYLDFLPRVFSYIKKRLKDKNFAKINNFLTNFI